MGGRKFFNLVSDELQRMKKTATWDYFHFSFREICEEKIQSSASSGLSILHVLRDGHQSSSRHGLYRLGMVARGTCRVLLQFSAVGFEIWLLATDSEDAPFIHHRRMRGGCDVKRLCCCCCRSSLLLVGWLAGCCQSGSGGVCLVSGLYQSSSNGWKPLVFK